MDYILTFDDSDELYHHGIKGQKWGIRRFQNYDGTYTKKGLARYNKAASQYEKAKQKQKEAKEQRNAAAKNSDEHLTLNADYKTAKRETRAARKQMRSSYRKLKQDYQADKGKELYKSGRTITGNYARYGAATTAGLLASFGALKLYDKGKINSKQAVAITWGANIAASLYGTKIESDNRKLRAYYAH